VSLSFFSFQQGYSQNCAVVGAAGLIMILSTPAAFLLPQRKFRDG
jgi:hypothetical protein